MYSWDRELEELLEDKLNEQWVSQRDSPMGIPLDL